MLRSWPSNSTTAMFCVSVLTSPVCVRALIDCGTGSQAEAARPAMLAVEKEMASSPMKVREKSRFTCRSRKLNWHE